MSVKEKVQETYTAQKVAQMRDELRVKMHLAKADALDEWQKLERKWAELEGKLATVKKVSAESAGEVREAAESLMKELADGYERIRRVL